MQAAASQQPTVGSLGSQDSGGGGDLGWSQNRGSAWGAPGSGKPDIVVDTQNTNEWPSIGTSVGSNDKPSSDAGSDVETASAKSGSVISSSSLPAHGLRDTSVPAESPNRAASSVWGSSFPGPDTSKAWPPGPPSLNSNVWSSGVPQGTGPNPPLPTSASNTPTSGWDGGSLNSENGQNRGWGSSSLTPEGAGGWGAPPASSSVIAPGISAEPVTSQLWGGSGDAGGWGGAGAAAPPKSSSNWGSPDPTPLPSGGTELWGNPGEKGGNLGSGSGGGGGGGGGGAGWGNKQSAPPPTSWASGSQPPNWGQAEMKANSGWNDNNKQLWGSAAPGGSQWPSSAPPPPSEAWGASGGAGVDDVSTSWSTTNPPPGPIGAQPAHNNHPGTFAEAAGKGLPPKPMDEVPPPAAVIKDRNNVTTDLVSQLVNNHDGWGKTPIKQDASWDNLPESPKLQRKILIPPPSTQPQEPVWTQPNDGTAIWESAKEPTGPPPMGFNGPSSNPPQGPPPPVAKGPGPWSSSDADAGHWDGPPNLNRAPSSQAGQWGQGGPTPIGSGGPKDQMWNDDHRTGVWGGGGGSNSSGSGNEWEPKKEDNNWNGNWSGGRTEMGHWGETRRVGSAHSSTSSWDGEDATPSNWGGGGGGGGGVDDGTAYWSGSGGPAWKNNNPSKPSVPWGNGPKPPNWHDGGQDDNNMWSGGQMDGNGRQPQMRSRLLQQLLNMGFRKEDAQRALITNNMNFENAVAELMAQNRPRENDLDQRTGRAVRPMHSSVEDLTTPQGATSAAGLDPMAASLLMNPQAAAAVAAAAQQKLPPALANQLLQNPSSLMNPSIINQMTMQNQLATAAVNKIPRPMNQQVRGQMSGQSQYHNQLTQQLHNAVLQGTIPANMASQMQNHTKSLVILQQLMQLQTLQQNLQAQQKEIQTKAPPSQAKVQQLDKLGQTIQDVRIQMRGLQQQLKLSATQAGNAPGAVPPQPPGGQVGGGPPGVLPGGMAQAQFGRDMDIGSLSLNPSAGGTSRLNQWTKPMGQSHSVPDLQAGMPGVPGMGDGGWGLGANNPWSSAEEKKAAENLAIEEFVPGKRWTGTHIRSVDDDPHMTPGSVNRSYSMSGVTEEAMMYAAGVGNKDMSPTTDGWGGNNRAPGGNKWSSGDGRQGGPPGLYPVRGGGYNRSVSVPAGPNQQIGGQKAAANISNWLALRNISSQVDSASLEALCRQQGPSVVAAFSKGVAVVGFTHKEDAMKAYKALNGISLVGSILAIDFISEADLAVLAGGGDNAFGMGNLGGGGGGGAKAGWNSAAGAGGGGQWHDNMWGQNDD